MDDERIVELYWQRDEKAVSLTTEKYGAYCFAVANNILHSGEDSEECVNETWLRAWNAMPPNRPRSLRMFLAKIARGVALNRYNAMNAEKRGGGATELVMDELAECLGGGIDTEQEYEARELERCINRFVRALPKRDGNVFVRRYFFNEPLSVIAERYGLTENNVCVILSRIRKKLRSELSKEGFI